MAPRRGNDRQDFFTVGSAGQRFEATLFEACGRYGRRLHAYVLMGNHCQVTPMAA